MGNLIEFKSVAKKWPIMVALIWTKCVLVSYSNRRMERKTKKEARGIGKFITRRKTILLLEVESSMITSSLLWNRSLTPKTVHFVSIFNDPKRD